MGTLYKQVVKDFGLFWSMVVGALLSPWLYHLTFLLPYGIFLMLLFTYTKMEPGTLRVTREQLLLVALQWVLGVGTYLLLSPHDELIAQGAALIILTPTATSAPVITSMLGGSIGYVATLLFITNGLMVFVGPLLLSLLYPNSGGGAYWTTALSIFCRIVLLLLLPLVLVVLLKHTSHRAFDRVRSYTPLTFYIWCSNLAIITANTIHFFEEHAEIDFAYGALIGSVALLVCILLFVVGRSVGAHCSGVRVNSGQALAQKNTVLAIWVSLTFMYPPVSLLPSFYVIWQNIINSFELAAHNRRREEHTGG